MRVSQNLILRPMTADDLRQLHEWLQRPHVVEWWSESAYRSFEEVRAKYMPRILARDGVTPYIAVLNGAAIGYAQTYVALGTGDGWWEDESDPGVRGIDQFLADGDQLGKGIGTQLVCAVVELLFADPAVTRIQTDPDLRNLRAIRCYEKAGFVPVREIVTPDGPALYMVRERQPGLKRGSGQTNRRP